MNELIQQLQAAGSIDSLGSFTVSGDRAREKLSQFALSDPHLYVLNLLAWAVAAGATKIEVHTGKHGLRFEHNGQPLRPQELSHLWNALLDPSKASQHELARALNAARSISPQELSLECWNEGQGCRLEVREEQLVIGVPETIESQPANRLTVRTSTHRKALRWLFGPPESSILRANLHHGPAEVCLDGKKLSQPLRLGHSSKCVAWLHTVSKEGPRLLVEPPDSSWSPACTVIGPTPSEDPFEAVLTLAPSSVCQNEGLLLIVHGLTFRRPAGLLGCFFACGAVRMDSLRKNISHSDLAEDDLYRDLLERLTHSVEMLIVKRMEDPSPLPQDMLLTFLSFARELEERLSARGLPKLRAVVVRWSKEAVFARDVLNDGNWRAVLSELEKLCNTASGEAMAGRLEKTLREAGYAQFLDGDIHLAVSHWERLVALGKVRNSPWLSAEQDQLIILRALCGISVDPQSVSHPQRRAELLRLLGRPAEALPLCQCARSRAETLLALEDFANAEALLRHQMANAPSRHAAEALSDLLAYAPPTDLSRRQEAFVWRETALQQFAEEWAECGDFLREDLAQLARSTVPFPRFLRHSLSARRTTIPTGLASCHAELEQGRAMLRRGDFGALRVKTALLSAEAKHVPSHPLLQAARVRAARILREAGRWKEADDVLARGQLLASFKK